jgi:hypothetical protein
LSVPQGGICKELFLTEARPCSAGGFVPTSVYEAIFDIDTQKRLEASELDSQSSPPAPKGPIRMSHLEATEFKNSKEPVRLERLENVKLIAAKGGMIPLTTKTPITIDRLKKMLGRKLTDSLPRSLPPIDRAELNEFSGRPQSHWLAYCLGISLAFAIGAGFLVRWRRARTALVIAALCGTAQPGCSSSGKAVLGLTGAFDQTRILYRREQTTLPLTLTVRNVGTVPLRLLNLDGGCTCRRVDTSVLPAVINPGKTYPLHVDMEARSLSGNEQYLFRAETDRGSVSIPVGLILFPRNRISPTVVGSPNLIEGDSWEFTLVQRAVFESASGPARLELQTTPEFVWTREEVKRGQVAVATQYDYEDTTYRVVLKDERLGLHKTVFALKHPDGHRELEIPVVWRRVGYLSAVPDRAFLGPRPFRVFLRCPDEEVELTQVLSAPEGVKAVVSSPREVTVMLSTSAPPVIDGVVRVGTTAKDRPPLRFPVSRYSVTQNVSISK